MEILMNLWFSFNVVFGVWSAKNWFVYLYASITSKYKFSQNQLGKMLDLIVLVSILTYFLSI